MTPSPPSSSRPRRATASSSPAPTRSWPGRPAFPPGWRWAWRRRRSRPLGQEAEVLARWAGADEVLSWVGLGRQPSETFDEYASRVSERIGWVATDEGLPDAVRRLAGLARQAAFAPRLP